MVGPVASRELCDWASSKDERVIGGVVSGDHQTLVKHQTSIIHSCSKDKPLLSLWRRKC